MNPKRLLARLKQGSLSNVSFSDAQRLIEALGFRFERVGQGRHHIYKHPDVSERLNLQPRQGQAKEYQLKQILVLIEEYDLDLEVK